MQCDTVNNRPVDFLIVMHGNIPKPTAFSLRLHHIVHIDLDSRRLLNQANTQH